MHEHVFASLTSDEAIAFFGVEPLNGAGSQSDPLSLLRGRTDRVPARLL